MRIIAFPFAGGNVYSYMSFRQALPREIEFIVIEYPGRGSRINEHLATTLDSLAEDAFQRTTEYANDNYIIYGHSMGAIIGLLVCLKIEKSKFTKPMKLIVSGSNAPSVTRKRRLSGLPDPLFWNELISMGGVPAELINEPSLLDFFGTILKSDFKVLEDYIYRHEHRLSIPVDVFYGSEEDIGDHEIEQWGKETSGVINIEKLGGGHFFIYDQGDFFKDYFIRLFKESNLVK